jgi:hypothetical protein
MPFGITPSPVSASRAAYYIAVCIISGGKEADNQLELSCVFDSADNNLWLLRELYTLCLSRLSSELPSPEILLH